jgi:DnaJ-domain-containing protein 1
MVAACALAMAIFPGEQAQAKDKSLKGELEHALVGQLVTSKILLGDRARPSDVAREGLALDFPVHTLVDAETGEIAYRVEEPLWLERAEVHQEEMLRSFEAGTSFRISAIHAKEDRIEVKLKQLGGGSAVVKLMMGKGWQSRYDAASVQVRLARVFSFEQSGQQQMEAGQVPRQAEPVETATQAITPAAPAAAVEAPANQASVPPNSAVHPEQSEPASQVSIRPAYVDCGALKQLELYPTPEASSSPVAVLQCGEKVMAIGEQNGWVKARTEQNVEGYLSHYFLRYDGPPSLGQSSAAQLGGPEGQPDSSAAIAPSPDENVQQSPPPQTTEQRPSTYAPPAEPSRTADDSWSWYQYALAWLLPLLVAVVLLIGLARGEKKRQQAKEARRRHEERLEAEKRKEEREERRGRNQAAHERASAKRQYSELVAQLTDLEATCGSQASEVLRAGMALEGANPVEIATPTELVVADVIRILSAISRVKEEIPIGLGRLLQAVYVSLNPESDISLERHIAKIDDIRQESRAASLPDMVMLLGLYDEMQGTRLAAKAANAYSALVRTACEIVDSKLGVATKLVQAKYLELLRPHLSGTGNNGDGSEQRARSNEVSDDSKSSFGGCLLCQKFYPVLRVNPNATKEEIKTAYRDLAKIFHSDRLQSYEDRVQRKADDELKDINEAYAHISSHWKSQ